MINIANLSEQETADLITIMCPADLAGVKCNQADCKFLRRCEVSLTFLVPYLLLTWYS